MFNKYDLLALPVVDKENRIVGIVTVDDAVDVMEEEATEDIEKMAAIRPSEKPYLKTDVLTIVRNRIVWLIVFMIIGIFIGLLLNIYEDTIKLFPILVTFIPMLTDTGGNSGTQAATMVIRGLTLDEIQPKDIGKIIWKEIRVGLICGIILAVIDFAIMQLIYPGKLVLTGVVAASIIVIVLMSKLIGCTMPILAKVMKWDPANTAAPLLSTIIDAAGLIVFFAIASHIL